VSCETFTYDAFGNISKSGSPAIVRNGLRSPSKCATVPEWWHRKIRLSENSGGPAATRTPDLYRVKVAFYHIHRHVRSQRPPSASNINGAVCWLVAGLAQSARVTAARIVSFIDSPPP
jgi:hypothetical protein